MKKLIYVVDDDPVYLKMMEGHFKLMSEFDPKVFKTGPDAIKALSEAVPFAILLDHQFVNDPQKTGLDYLREIRKLNSKVPVLYITGTRNEEIQAAAAKLKVNGYIIKDGASLVHLRAALDKISEQSKSKGVFSKIFKKK
jgi:two-component system nitrogen regulation response regulator GlnG